MTDIAQKKDFIKKNIRSLLLSSPAALTIDELKRDYHSFIGEPIEFRKMGYVSLEGFLRDIGDAVSVSYRNGLMTLKANADETTMHIQRLVSKQKVPNKKKYAVYRQRGGSGPPRRYQAPEANRFPPRRQNQQMVPPKPVVPAFVRHQMQDLFCSFPDGISVMQLDKAFLRRFGTGINYRHYGFLNQYEFLQSMYDILSVEELGKGNWYVLPIGYKRKSKEPIAAVSPVPEPNVQPVAEKPVNSLNKQSRPSKGRGRRRQQSGGSDGMTGHDARSVGSNSSQDDDILERNIQKVLEKHPNGLWASSFSQEYLATHSKPIVYKNLGHLSVIDLVASMPHIVGIRRPTPQGDWMLYDARNAPEKESSKSRSRQNSGKAVEAETKEAIQYILNSHPNGVNVKDFPNLFKECTGKDLQYEELGFNLAEDLFVSLADSDLQISYTGSGMAMFPMNAEIPELTGMVLDRFSNTPEIEGCPQDVVGPGCHFVPVMLPDQDQYIELFVTNIISPSLFWIMLRHKTKSLALEALMDRLDEVYKHDSDAYKMPESLMVPGQVCAALFPEDNNWHRTVITGSNDEGFIQLYYVDYGNTNFVTKSSLRFLKTDFLTLPAQAVQARLANTQPPAGGKWKNKSRNRLLELTSHRPLVAYVFEVKNQKMSICLTDTNDSQIDVHINDVMVNEGLAEFTPDKEVTTDSAPVHAMEPDYGKVFGWNVTEVPRLPKVIQGQGGEDVVFKSECDENEYRNTRCYVKWIQLTDNYIIHLISLDRVAYILSAEISILFWEEDILTSMLKQRRVDIQKNTVRIDEYPELFNDLKNYNVPSLMSNEIVERKFVSLYKLESLPKILRVFEHEDENLLKSVDELVNKFDPDSPYWKSGEQIAENEKSEEKTENDTDDISLEEKQTALQTLQFKRKRILQTMISNPDLLTDDMVNELNNIEIEIVMIKQQIKDQQTAGKTNSQTVTQSNQLEKQEKQDTSPQMSENQRAIQNIMNSTTKPIATANIMTQAPASVSTINQQTQLTQSATHEGVTSSSWMPTSMAGNFPDMSQSTTGNFQGMSPSMVGSFNDMSRSMAGNFPGMMSQSMAGSFPSMMSQSMAGSFPGIMPQSMAGSFPGMMSQSTGSFPGLLGVQGIPNPRLMNPGLMNQAGLPCSGMGDLTNSMFPRAMGFGPNLNPNFQQGFLQQFNPLMMPCQNVGDPNQTGMPRAAFMTNIGRGQTLAPGILPGLLPLVQNLNLGRGSGS